MAIPATTKRKPHKGETEHGQCIYTPSHTERTYTESCADESDAFAFTYPDTRDGETVRGITRELTHAVRKVYGNSLLMTRVEGDVASPPVIR